MYRSALTTQLKLWASVYQLEFTLQSTNLLFVVKQMITQKQIEKIVKRIIKHYRPDKIILFGSYAYGNPTEHSDLDLLIVKNSNLPRYKRAREIRKYLWEISDTPKDIIVYTQEEIDDWIEVEEAFITNIVKEGKVLYENKSGLNKKLD